MIVLIGLWSHALAALLYGALAVWQLRHWHGQPGNRPLVAAFAATSLWAIFVATLGPSHALAGLGESARNFAFLSFMYDIVRAADEDDRQRALKAVYVTLAGVIGLQVTVAGVLPRFAGEPTVHAALISTLHLIGLTIASGSLILVHNLYGQAAPDSRWGIRLPAIALAGMWLYDLHLYTVSHLSGNNVDDLFALRGAILAMLVPLFTIASRRNADWKMRVSRQATFQSLSIFAIFGYLILMMSARQALEIIGGDWVRVGQLALVFAVTLAAAILLPSAKARAWLSVFLAKHFFEHRYDYRKEWLGFTRTIGRAGQDAAPLADRIVKALADITGSPSALLLSADDQHRLSVAARWHWHGADSFAGADNRDYVRLLESSGHVIDFGQDEDAWAGIPLIHGDRLLGVALLAHPPVRRPLDWEDFDLFRSAGTQAASYLAEARANEALAHADRFDEFNRRFAFIMHDIKNVVSQLSLVARNAERHAENPEFRADMIVTLQSSVKKMNDLLARLSAGKPTEAEPLRQTEVHPLARAIAATKSRSHPVTLTGDADASAIADPARLEQAIAHLVQNAIDASDPESPVRLEIAARDGEILIKIEDSGCGMSGEFVRTRLFQPFASSKPGGFGIGAYEARALVAAMGGRLDVESREGVGSRFTITLPAGAARPALPQIERMRA